MSSVGDGVIEMINRYGAKLLGYTESDLIGRNWFEMIVPFPIRESRIAAFEQMISGLLNVDDRIYHGPGSVQ